MQMISSRCSSSSASSHISGVYYSAYCSRLKEIGRFRVLKEENEEEMNKTTKEEKHPEISAKKEFLDLSTNDYLMMSQRKELAEASIAAMRRWGIGSTGSRLLSGNRFPPLWNLERQIARDKHTESALVFNTGFQANVSVLSSLLDASIFSTNNGILNPPADSRPIVFFDRNNHSSLYNALRMAKGDPVECYRYAHNDFDHLESLLEKHAKNCRRPKFLVTESVFSMDGDILPMDDLLTLLEKYPDLFVYLDEAHATGLMGQTGYGLSSILNKVTDSYVAMGTFGKALGGFGAYVACPLSIRDYLINRCPGFIYTTALPPSVIGAAFAAWQMVPSMVDERKRLLETAVEMKRKLRNELGLNIGIGKGGIPSTPILPIVLGDDWKTMEAKERLLRHHRINVSGIRAPTVPQGTARLRLSLTTGTIEDEHILRILDALKETLLNK